MSTYWVVAAGSRGRGYSKLFLRFSMAFFWAEKNTHKQIKVGDTVILGQREKEIKIVAAGRVVSREGKHSGLGDKEWLSDVDGWELPAWCYVDWKKPEGGPISVTGFPSILRPLFKTGTPEPRKEAERILATGYTPKETGYKEPEKTKKVTDQKLLETLVREGLSTSSANELTNAVAKIRLLADYYRSYGGEEILEHEARTFLVIPLLLALGWSEQQIKIELSGGKGKKIDIVCFSKPYKNKEESKENCVAIIETKGFASGLDYARDQAEAYSVSFPNCKVLITTNGYCYKIYLRNETDGSFPEDPYNPSAYINLLDPRDKYPLNPKEDNGALYAIKWLLPNNLIQTA